MSKVMIFGEEFDLSTEEGINGLSDLIDSSEANSVKQIAISLVVELASTPKPSTECCITACYPEID